MKDLLKDAVVQVNFNDQDADDLDVAVEYERRQRKDMTVGRATLVREQAMPGIRKIAAKARAEQDAT